MRRRAGRPRWQRPGCCPRRATNGYATSSPPRCPGWTAAAVPTCGRWLAGLDGLLCASEAAARAVRAVPVRARRRARRCGGARRGCDVARAARRRGAAADRAPKRRRCACRRRRPGRRCWPPRRSWQRKHRSRRRLRRQQTLARGRARAAQRKRVWRVRELPYGHGSFARDLPGLLSSRASPPASYRSTPRWPCAAAPGVIDGPDGRCALSVIAPLGRLTAAQWRLLAALVAEHGEDAGELRLTPWRGVILAGAATRRGHGAAARAGRRRADHATRLPLAGRRRLHGRPGCAKSAPRRTGRRGGRAHRQRGGPRQSAPRVLVRLRAPLRTSRRRQGRCRGRRTATRRRLDQDSTDKRAVPGVPPATGAGTNSPPPSHQHVHVPVRRRHGDGSTAVERERSVRADPGHAGTTYRVREGRRGDLPPVLRHHPRRGGPRGPARRRQPGRGPDDPRLRHGRPRTRPRPTRPEWWPAPARRCAPARRSSAMSPMVASGVTRKRLPAGQRRGLHPVRPVRARARRQDGHHAQRRRAGAVAGPAGGRGGRRRQRAHRALPAAGDDRGGRAPARPPSSACRSASSAPPSPRTRSPPTRPVSTTWSCGAAAAAAPSPRPRSTRSRARKSEQRAQHGSRTHATGRSTASGSAPATRR